MHVPFPRDHSFYGSPRHYSYSPRRSPAHEPRSPAAAPFTTRGHGAGGGRPALRSAAASKEPCRPLPRVLEQSLGGLRAHLAAVRREHRAAGGIARPEPSLSLPRIDAIVL